MRQLIAAVLLAVAAAAGAQDDRDGLPAAILVQGLPIAFPADVDSNSPAFWADGRLHVFNSLYHPYLSEGRSVARLAMPVGVLFRGGVPGPRWMESVIQDADGTLYGFYHHEPSVVCNGGGKTAPQIDAARSRDGGFGWDDLGIILAAPSNSRQCATENLYFVGGEGDFSAVLDRDRAFVYFLFSAYPRDVDNQGIAAAARGRRRLVPAGHGARARARDGHAGRPVRAILHGWPVRLPHPVRPPCDAPGRRRRRKRMGAA